jgi:hypothetical protein
MVTVICKDNKCVLGNEERNVFGTPPFVECGGCGAHLEPFDPRPDPPELDPPA